MMRVATREGPVVVLEAFDVRVCVIESLRDLQRIIPRCELCVCGGTFIQVRQLVIDFEAIERLNLAA